ncbi:hypothetical protein GIB67_002153 [Kingdonia uniflora]|uniref:Uncharacterized protein n=1 Tax=Kingdonia uniflora TaxID=39325 RepID=A0A7J7KWR2_9MAGN|nr:hypothetical protein GIB67_002153 [Kingdonia uniflora]
MTGIKAKGNSCRLSGELILHEEAPTAVDRKCGGWITFPYIIATVLGLTITGGGLMSNLIVYLIERFNIKSIDAAQISNVVNGCTSLFPIAGAIVADSWLGSFSVIFISSIISLLGMILLTLTVTLPSLTPPYCEKGSKCDPPTKIQLAILYATITLVSIGLGGTRFTIATMGADQFDKAKDQGTFFNWYFFTLYLGFLIGATGIVYIQDNIGWGLGFGLCLAAGALGFSIFLSGKNVYRHVKPKGSSFTSLARVLIATVRKRKLSVASVSNDYYLGNNIESKNQFITPSSSFRLLNRAAINTESDTNEDGSIAKPWRLCTVQQVEDLKTLIHIFPLWSTSIFLSTPIGIQSSLVVLQALTMDRHIGSHFQVPAGSFLVFTLLSTAICLSVIDRLFFPMWQILAQRPLTPLQRVGFGHILNIVGMAGSALVESRRLHAFRSHYNANQPDSTVPMSAMWLVGPLAIVGVGEAFHFPGQVALYYQEFPMSLRSTATAMISLLIAVGFYLSTALINLIRRVTVWLPDNINKGRLDNVFWLLVVIGLVNFGYYLLCAIMYRYKNVENADDDSGIH